jgi:uncharacterized protein (TIGR03083 family)
VSRTQGSKDFWLTAVRTDGSAFVAAVGQPGLLGAPVPSCPGWSVGELVRHLGGVYRRTRTHGGSGDATESWGPVAIPEDAPPAEAEDVVAWFRDELAAIDTFLENLDPDLPAWNWAPQSRTAGFWIRRTAHETAVHRWDSQLATGLPEPLESKLAGDTVAEALDTFLPAGRRPGPSDVHGVVQLTATDLGQEWFVRLKGGGVALLDTDTLLDDDEHPTRAVASGTASDLALALWGRVTFDVLETAGDDTLLEALRVS